MSTPLIIGIGNRYRGDDAIGPLVAEQIQLPDTEVTTCEKDVMTLMDLWENRNHVFLIDAVCTEEYSPGHIHHFNAAREAIPAIFTGTSTHVLDVVQVIELAKTLGKLPASVYFYGIEGKHFQIESGLSLELKKQVDSICHTIQTDIELRLTTTRNADA